MFRKKIEKWISFCEIEFEMRKKIKELNSSRIPRNKLHEIKCK